MNCETITLTWATQQLLLKNATKNLTKDETDAYKKLVQDYQESLLINGYKEKLIKQQLDTVITQNELLSYYHTHKNNFPLKEPLLQIKSIDFNADDTDKKEIIKLFQSSKEADLDSLETKIIRFKKYQLRDSLWVTLPQFYKENPKFNTESTSKLLKISKMIKKEDSLRVYLVAVNKVLQKNDIAPLRYINSKIRQIILHKRKLELIRNIEKTLLNDAVQNKHFKEF